ncbi:MAG: APC family permease [Bryobacteraceae bacterium]
MVDSTASLPFSYEFGAQYRTLDDDRAGHQLYYRQRHLWNTRGINSTSGPGQPLAMVIAALAMAVIMACVAEVASYFSEAGGAYLYVRTAVGRFAGLQVGWFWLLAVVGGGAANVALFADYLGGLLPAVAQGPERMMIVTALVALPAIVNYTGVRSGARLSTILVIAKLIPLVLLIVLGLPRLSDPVPGVAVQSLAPNLRAWLNALLLLLFSYAGYEDTLVPMGEVKDPRRTVPFALAVGLSVSAIVYSLLQAVVVASIGTAATDRPLAAAASVLIGDGGRFVAIAVMISTYGWVSASLLNAPRFAYALAAQGDLPERAGTLHPRFHTPAAAIGVCAVLMWALAMTGTFLWVLALTAGSTMVVYSGICASLLRLRRTHANVEAMRVPGGPVLAILGVVICLVLLTQLQFREVALMTLTALVAWVNWLWARRRNVST